MANRKYLNLDTEYALFNEVINWSLAEARRRSISADDWIAMRSILIENSIFKAIRFLAMKPEEIAKAIAKTSNMIEASGASELASSIVAKNSSNGLIGSNPGNSSAELAGSGDESAGGGFRIDVGDSNSLLTESEQRAILLNLALTNIAKLPATLNASAKIRHAPPEYFTLKRFKSSSGSLSNATLTTTTTTRSIKSITSKFQCLSENVFIVALTIPIRLDVSSYSNRTPKFECHLKFTTKATSQPISSNGTFSPLVTETGAQQQESSIGNLDGSTLLMDTIDESLHISIARDKDCLVRLKRPILIRMGNLNELNLTFQTYALDEDVVALRTPKSRSANFSEQTDTENISWLFFKTSNIEFSELHYYY